MILQSLAAYYDRLLKKGDLPAIGLQIKEIHWVIEIDSDGTFVSLIRTGAEERGKPATVPYEVKRTGNVLANLLWDNAEYVLGYSGGKQSLKSKKKNAAFVARLDTLPDHIKADEGIAAVRAFYASENISKNISAMRGAVSWDSLIADGGNVSFRLKGAPHLVCENPALHEGLRCAALEEYGHSEDTVRCAVTGSNVKSIRLHPSIKGVKGGNPTGTSLVSFNLDAFNSHGWDQSGNAPVAPLIAFAYTAALNRLLARDNKDRRLVEGDTTFVFWAREETPMESLLGECFSGFEQAPPTDTKPVKKTLGMVRRGLGGFEDDNTPFFVLGLAPNAARLAVRFWFEGTVEALAKDLRQHFRDLEIIGLGKDEDALPSLWRILGAVAIEGDPKKLQDNLRGGLGADVVRAAIEGAAYPATLLARTIERCRAEQGVTVIRAAVIKAVLNRRNRISTIQEKEIKVGLDPDNASPGYLLGRLFAVMEGIQEAADPSINTTIRDRYFGAAGSAPRSVFIQLSRLKNAHLKKVRRQNPGYAVRYEKLINSIMAKLGGDKPFPTHLALDDQGRFIVGYHHQNKDLYTKHDTEN